MGYRGLAVNRPVFSAKTASYSVLPEDDGLTFTTRGHTSGTITFTLPPVNRLAAGWSARFFGIGAGEFKVASTEGDNIVCHNDVDLDSVNFLTSGDIIGSAVTMEFDGTSFLAFLSLDDAVTVGLTD
jgi:hypothetical protein